MRLAIFRKQSHAINVIVRKFQTLVLHPVEVYHKYMRKIKALGEIPPVYREDYDWHWNRDLTSYKNKTVLDLGADYGSTAYYFLRKGQAK